MNQTEMGSRFRKSKWFNLVTDTFVYCIQTQHKGKWVTLGDENGALFFDTEAARDAKLKDFKTNGLPCDRGARWLNNIIAKSDLSINDFCALTGVSRDMLYKWRSGKRGMPVSRLKMFQLIEWIIDNDMLYRYVKETKNDTNV